MTLARSTSRDPRSKETREDTRGQRALTHHVLSSSGVLADLVHHLKQRWQGYDPQCGLLCGGAGGTSGK